MLRKVVDSINIDTEFAMNSVSFSFTLVSLRALCGEAYSPRNISVNFPLLFNVCSVFCGATR
jgi:hypothetical protein